jgi:hypothetical protein
VDIYSRIYDRENELIRAGMVHLLSGAIPLYVVNEFPKAGGTWVGQMLGRALGVPFPRNRLPVFRKSIMHGHYLSPWGIKNVVVAWRDGRDVMVSWYHQQLIPHEWNRAQVARSRRELPLEDYDDVYGNLRRDTPAELRRIVRKLTGEEPSTQEASAVAEEFSFERQSGRRAGEENRGGFLRKGVVGDWRGRFSPEAREVFDRYAGEELILLGYERDRSWVTEA